MSFQPTSVKFNLDLPPRDSTGPINNFGQHRYVVLRKVIDEPNHSEAELQTMLMMPNARISEILASLEENHHIMKATDGTYVATELGVQKVHSL